MKDPVSRMCLTIIFCGFPLFRKTKKGRVKPDAYKTSAGIVIDIISFAQENIRNVPTSKKIIDNFKATIQSNDCNKEGEAG